MKHEKDEEQILLDKDYNDDIELNTGKKEKSKFHADKSGSSYSYLLTFICVALILGIAILIITLLIDNNVFSTNINYFRSDNLIAKPQSDFRKYRTLKLRNGLEVVIISDPLSVTSGASLSVRVGANNDPKELLGLAHFCEHMLFLGSGKYPNGDDYFKTVTENSGHFNAYTDREITNYFFDIHYFSFEKALDIFSRFFIDPLFNEDKVNKEVNSVNSEFEKNLIIDSRKRTQVFAYLGNKESPFSRFTTGNIQTLIKAAENLGLNLRDELIKFHKKFYVADKMKLVVYTNEDLDDMEEIVVEKFSEIKSGKDKENKKITTINTNSSSSVINNKNSTSGNIFANLLSKFTNKKEEEYPIKSLSERSVKPFKSPFNKEVFGSFIKFNSVTLEHELSIHFIQKPLNHDDYFFHNPYYYFYYIFESKDEHSLIDSLKKSQLASKLSVQNDRDYFEWSDFILSISLTKQGLKEIDKVLAIVKKYLDYVKSNLVNEKYYQYLQKVDKLNFEYKPLHTSLVYETVSKLGAKFQRYPINYLLNDIHLTNPFNSSILLDYAENLNLENSIIFIPSKQTYNATFSMLIKESEKVDYEPWYRTNFTFYKIDFGKLEDTDSIEEQIKTKNNKNVNNTVQIIGGKVKLIDEMQISKLINNTPQCERKCIEKLKSFSTNEPYLLNKTNNFEFWYKKENTLDFKKVIVSLLFKYDRFKSSDDKIYIILFETLLKRKLKKLNSKLKIFQNSISVSYSKYGLKISYSSYSEMLKENTKDLVDKIHSVISKEKVFKDFTLITQELHDRLMKDYNSQPWQLAFDYIKEHLLNEYLTTEDCLQLLAKANSDNFVKFIQDFQKNYYLKLYISGDIEESAAREVFDIYNPILKLSSITNTKNFKWSIKEKRKSRKAVLKMNTGNFLLKKVYHQPTNKNNALLKCYKTGKNTYKNELIVKLFSSIIGNIVFRELRINKQFGYVAKSRVELFDNYYFYCVFVQGSSKLPHTIDDAAIELLETTIKSQLDNMSNGEFNTAKVKNFDTIANSRLDLTKTTARAFTPILENTYLFHNFDQMDKYSRSVQKIDILNFFKDKFLGDSGLRFTIYMYSKQVKKGDMKLNSQRGKEYQEVTDD